MTETAASSAVHLKMDACTHLCDCHLVKVGHHDTQSVLGLVDEGAAVVPDPPEHILGAALAARATQALAPENEGQTGNGQGGWMGGGLQRVRM